MKFKNLIFDQSPFGPVGGTFYVKTHFFISDFFMFLYSFVFSSFIH